MQAQEILLAPANIGLDIINKVRRSVASPFDSRGLGERLMREHTTHQIDASLQEMSARIHDREIVLLGARHIVAVMARGDGQTPQLLASSTESVSVAAESTVRALFPGNNLGRTALPLAEVKLPSQR